MFPIINTIDDVLPHIKDNDNFKVNYKNDYTVIDYILNTPECFNNSVEKECRGIIFETLTGKIISRPLAKFFNLNEREESKIENFDLSNKHWILEKLDGSMIRPFYSYGKLVWGSKAGETFLSPMVEEFVKTKPWYIEFAEDCILKNLTPIFEFCSNKNRIVLSYPEDRLVLLAVRHNVTGEYFKYDSLLKIGEEYGVEIVKQYEGSVRNMLQISDTIKEMTGIEGFVVVFDDGYRVKIKCDEYCLYHRAKEDITREKNVIEILVDNKADDFRTLLSPFDLIKFEEFEKQFWYNIREKVIKISDLSSKFNYKTMSRKIFSLEFSKNLTDYEKSIIFRLYDENIDLTVRRDLVKMEIINIIKKKVGSQTGVDLVRNLWGDLKWNY